MPAYPDIETPDATSQAADHPALLVITLVLSAVIDLTVVIGTGIADPAAPPKIPASPVERAETIVFRAFLRNSAFSARNPQ